MSQLPPKRSGARSHLVNFLSRLVEDWSSLPLSQSHTHKHTHMQIAIWPKDIWIREIQQHSCIIMPCICLYWDYLIPNNKPQYRRSIGYPALIRIHRPQIKRNHRPVGFNQLTAPPVICKVFLCCWPLSHSIGYSYRSAHCVLHLALWAPEHPVRLGSHGT